MWLPRDTTQRLDSGERSVCLGPGLPSLLISHTHLRREARASLLPTRVTFAIFNTAASAGLSVLTTRDGRGGTDTVEVLI